MTTVVSESSGPGIFVMCIEGAAVSPLGKGMRTGRARLSIVHICPIFLFHYFVELMQEILSLVFFYHLELRALSIRRIVFINQPRQRQSNIDGKFFSDIPTHCCVSSQFFVCNTSAAFLICDANLLQHFLSCVSSVISARSLRIVKERQN